MKQLNNFIEKASYVSPSCKSVVLRAAQSILTGSNWGELGRAGGQGRYDDETEGEDY